MRLLAGKTVFNPGKKKEIIEEEKKAGFFLVPHAVQTYPKGRIRLSPLKSMVRTNVGGWNGQ